MVAPLDFVSLLFTKLQGQEPHVEVVLSHSMVWVIPSLNPDTYDRNVLQFEKTQRYGMRRKNQHPVCSKSMFSVSLCVLSAVFIWITASI